MITYIQTHFEIINWILMVVTVICLITSFVFDARNTKVAHAARSWTIGATFLFAAVSEATTVWAVADGNSSVMSITQLVIASFVVLILLSMLILFFMASKFREPVVEKME